MFIIKFFLKLLLVPVCLILAFICLVIGLFVTIYERMDEPYKRFEKAVVEYDKNSFSELLDLLNEVTSETAAVYMEIGLQIGFF